MPKQFSTIRRKISEKNLLKEIRISPFAMILEISEKRSVSLEPGQLYLLGRKTGHKKTSTNFIELDEEESISERHCVIEADRNEGAFVYDLFSFKGTILNNKILDSMQKASLKNGDILKIGGKEIKYINNQRLDMSCNSSGFVEVQRNTSDVTSTSPESTPLAQKSSKTSDDHNFLKPTRPSTSFSSRRSDSFTIPETQPCKPRNSLNDSTLSVAESIPDKSGLKIPFGFGNQDSFADEDLCIPETQELPPLGGVSSNQRPGLFSQVERELEQQSVLKEASSTLENGNISEGSQFRICTQDYNEGFGEEEVGDNMHSQIIPIIKHLPIILKTPVNEIGLDAADNEISALKLSNSNAERKSKDWRSDCITPDLFEFEPMDNKEYGENAEESPVQQSANELDEEGDQEDLLPTQRPPRVGKKFEERNLLNEPEKPCLEKDYEDVLTLSDKENRCPGILLPTTDVPETQILEAAKCHTSVTHSNSLSSDIKANSSSVNKNSSVSLLNTDPDEEDDLLTQAFLQPKNMASGSGSRTTKEMASNKIFNSTLLGEEKSTEKIIELDKNPLKQIPAASGNIFKRPDKELGMLKKNCSASSTASESDVDLLLCTPQLIRDNLSVGRSDDLRKHILAVKNRYLFGDDNEDEEDESHSLVKLINNPKSALDFDHLLPHLNRPPDDSSEEPNEQVEAQKVYKFNISFGREQDEKQSRLSNSKPATYSRDERHAARDKEKELLERGETSKARKGKKKAATKPQEKKIEKEKEDKNRSSRRKRKDSEETQKNRQLEENQSKPDLKAKHSHKKSAKTKDEELQATKFLNRNNEETSSGPESTERPRKRKKNPDKTEKQETHTGNKQLATPARRLTRSKSRLEEILPSSRSENKDDLDSIPTQPNVSVKRTRSKTKQNEAPSRSNSANSAHTKSNDESKRNTIETKESPNSKAAPKKAERKRKAEAPTAAPPTKVERKRLRSAHSEETLTPSRSSVAISVTNVDHELIKDLLKDCKGLWNIATNAADCDILVMDKPLRTFKFLLAMARGIPIVTSEYLKKLNESKSTKEVNLKDYHFTDNTFQKKYKFSFSKSLHLAKKQKMFKNYEFVMTANILPIPQELKAIIEVSGGVVHNRIPSQPKENQNLYLITAIEDKKDWHKYRRVNKDIIIVSTEAIMSAIMSQSTERMKRFTFA